MIVNLIFELNPFDIDNARGIKEMHVPINSKKLLFSN
jgi:hypothetical protein